MAEEDKTTALVSLAALPRFVRFFPTDQELVRGFLSMKLGAGADGGESWGDHDTWAAFSAMFVPTVDLYGDEAYPWRVCQQLAYPYGLGSTEFYCFTPRKKKHANGDCRPDRTVGSGTWSASGSVADGKIYHRGDLVGHKANLTFKIMPPGGNKKAENTHWVMHEYRLERKGFQEMVLCRVRNQKKERDQEHDQKSNQKKERDQAKKRWKTPWWEEQQPQQVRVVNGGGGDGNCISGGAQKRKAAPLCSEDAGAPPQQRRLEIAPPAPPQAPVIQMPQQRSAAVLSPSVATSPFCSTTAAPPKDEVQRFMSTGGFGGADLQHDQLLQEDMVDVGAPPPQQQQKLEIAPPVLPQAPVIQMRQQRSAAVLSPSVGTSPFSSTTAAPPKDEVQCFCPVSTGGFGGADLQHDQLVQEAMDAGAPPPQQQRRLEIIKAAPLQMRQQQPDVLPAPPALLSPSAATLPFSSTTTTTAASLKDVQVQEGFWPLISTGGGFGGADQHDQLLQELIDYYTQQEEAASVAHLQQQGQVDNLCSTGATPLTASAAEVVAASAEPAAAGISTVAGLSLSTRAGAEGTAGWTYNMELLYWRYMAFDAGDPCWIQLLPSCIVEDEEEEGEYFGLWD